MVNLVDLVESLPTGWFSVGVYGKIVIASFSVD